LNPDVNNVVASRRPRLRRATGDPSRLSCRCMVPIAALSTAAAMAMAAKRNAEVLAATLLSIQLGAIAFLRLLSPTGVPGAVTGALCSAITALIFHSSGVAGIVDPPAGSPVAAWVSGAVRRLDRDDRTRFVATAGVLAYDLFAVHLLLPRLGHVGRMTSRAASSAATGIPLGLALWVAIRALLLATSPADGERLIRHAGASKTPQAAVAAALLADFELLRSVVTRPPEVRLRNDEGGRPSPSRVRSQPRLLNTVEEVVEPEDEGARSPGCDGLARPGDASDLPISIPVLSETPSGRGDARGASRGENLRGGGGDPSEEVLQVMRQGVDEDMTPAKEMQETRSEASSPQKTHPPKAMAGAVLDVMKSFALPGDVSSDSLVDLVDPEEPSPRYNEGNARVPPSARAVVAAWDGGETDAEADGDALALALDADPVTEIFLRDFQELDDDALGLWHAAPEHCSWQAWDAAASFELSAQAHSPAKGGATIPAALAATCLVVGPEGAINARVPDAMSWLCAGHAPPATPVPVTVQTRPLVSAAPRSAFPLRLVSVPGGAVGPDLLRMLLAGAIPDDTDVDAVDLSAAAERAAEGVGIEDRPQVALIAVSASTVLSGDDVVEKWVTEAVALSRALSVTPILAVAYSEAMFRNDDEHATPMFRNALQWIDAAGLDSSDLHLVRVPPSPARGGQPLGDLPMPALARDLVRAVLGGSLRTRDRAPKMLRAVAPAPGGGRNAASATAPQDPEAASATSPQDPEALASDAVEASTPGRSRPSPAPGTPASLVTELAQLADEAARGPSSASGTPEAAPREAQEEVPPTPELARSPSLPGTEPRSESGGEVVDDEAGAEAGAEALNMSGLSTGSPVAVPVTPPPPILAALAASRGTGRSPNENTAPDGAAAQPDAAARRAAAADGEGMVLGGNVQRSEEWLPEARANVSDGPAMMRPPPGKQVKTDKAGGIGVLFKKIAESRKEKKERRERRRMTKKGWGSKANSNANSRAESVAEDPVSGDEDSEAEDWAAAEAGRPEALERLDSDAYLSTPRDGDAARRLRMKLDLTDEKTRVAVTPP